MKAVVYSEYGTPDVLKLKEVDKPVPGDNDVLIRIHAADATKADYEFRSFHFPVKWFWLPHRIGMDILKPRRQILGGYFSGEVASAAKSVINFKK